jgi:hypothetical protein
MTTVLKRLRSTKDCNARRRKMRRRRRRLLC